MIIKYEGECVGGPLDKQRLAHTSKTKAFYRPIVAYMTTNIENAPVEAIEIGEYRLNAFNQWHWWPTEAGRAMDTLFGEARKP